MPEGHAVKLRARRQAEGHTEPRPTARPPTHLVPCTRAPPSASLARRTLRVTLSFTELFSASKRSHTADRVPAGRQASLQSVRVCLPRTLNQQGTGWQAANQLG
jgi:hypothetical protein